MKPAPDPCHRWDKLGLFVLAGLALAVLAIMIAGPIWKGKLPESAETLFGTMVAGILLFLRDIVAAIRAGWEEVTRGKVNEQLANAAPPADPAPANAAEAANQVADAAVDRASEISGDPPS